jgi:hypothetical protein
MIDLNQIQQIEDKNYKWSYNSNIVCPYCGYENEPDSENDNNNFDETHETECGNCEKHFMFIPICTIDYSSEPIENYYISEVKNLNNNINRYSEESKKEKDEKYTWYYDTLLKQYKQKLDDLNKKFQKYFEENSECE